MCLKVCQTSLGLASQTSQGEKSRLPEMEKEAGTVAGPHSKLIPTLLFLVILGYFDFRTFFLIKGVFVTFFLLFLVTYGCCTKPAKSEEKKLIFCPVSILGGIYIIFF